MSQVGANVAEHLARMARDRPYAPALAAPSGRTAADGVGALSIEKALGLDEAAMALALVPGAVVPLTLVVALKRHVPLAFPLAADELAADPLAPGPPHPVSLAEYRKALEPHGFRVEPGCPRASPTSVPARIANEQVIWWSR